MVGLLCMYKLIYRASEMGDTVPSVCDGHLDEGARHHAQHRHEQGQGPSHQTKFYT